MTAEEDELLAIHIQDEDAQWFKAQAIIEQIMPHLDMVRMLSIMARDNPRFFIQAFLNEFGDAQIEQGEQIIAKAMSLLHTEGKVAAIRSFRADTNCGLKASKWAVEHYSRERNVVPRDRETVDQTITDIGREELFNIRRALQSDAVNIAGATAREKFEQISREIDAEEMRLAARPKHKSEGSW